MSIRSLVVCQLNPWPATSGARQRIELLSTGLADLGPVDVFHFRGPNAFDETDVPAWVGRHGSTPKPVPSADARPSVIGAAARAYLRGMPRQFGAPRARRDHATAAFRRFVGGRRYAIVLVVRQQTLVLTGHLDQVARDTTIVDVDDLEDDKLRQRRLSLLLRGWRHLPAAALMTADITLWRRSHRRLGRSDALALACNATDARRLRALGVEAAVVPNAYPTDLASLRGAALTARDDGVFVGSPLYLPNRQAVDLLRRHIVPAIRADDDAFQMHIAGGCNGPAQDGVTYHGYVDDLGSLLRPGRLAVLPIFEQSGTSIKVLDSARRGATIITTPAAVRGLDFEDGRHYLAAASIDEFVAAARYARARPTLAHAIGRNARDQVIDRFSPDSTRARFTAIARRRLPRAPIDTGARL